MAKTAMQELIEYLDKYAEITGVVGSLIKEKATELKDKEVENIITAYDQSKVRTFANGVQYYNDNFKK